jgi:hypothetical protein
MLSTDPGDDSMMIFLRMSDFSNRLMERMHSMPAQTIRIPGLHRLGSRLVLVAGVILTLESVSLAWSGPVTVTVRVNQPGPKIDPIFYGLMTDEINYSYDGGLYGELIRNRIFQDRPIVPRAPRPPASNAAGSRQGAQPTPATPPPPPPPLPETPSPGSNPAVTKKSKSDQLVARDQQRRGRRHGHRYQQSGQCNRAEVQPSS